MGQGKNRTVIINLNSKLLKFMASLYSDSDGETANEESANEETNEQPDTKICLISKVENLLNKEIKKEKY